MALVFFIPNFPFLVPFTIFLIGILWIFNLAITRFKFTFSQLHYLMLAFYAINLLGMIYTEPQNYSLGWFDLEIKLSFLLMPLFFASFKPISKQNITQLIKLFVLAVLFAGTWHFIRSNYLFYSGLENLYIFYGAGFTSPLHLGYFALYLNFALFVALCFFQESQKLKHKILWLLAGLILLFYLFLTSSKAGLISFGIIFFAYGSYKLFFSKSNQKKWFMIPFLAVIVVIGLLFSQNSKTLLRFKTALNQITETEISPNSTGSTQARIFAFKTAINLIENNFILGVGTGDIDVETKFHYQQNGYTGALARNLNAHNQFLQTFGAVGLFGFLNLLLIFVVLIYFGALFKNQIVLFFSGLSFLFAITESMLETQAGIVFFTLFTLILTSQKKSSHDTIFTTSGRSKNH